MSEDWNVFRNFWARKSARIPADMRARHVDIIANITVRMSPPFSLDEFVIDLVLQEYADVWDHSQILMG